MDGRLRDRARADVDVGRTAEDRICAGGSGVVGDSGWEVSPPWNPGTIDGRRSTSRTGLISNPSVVSMEGIAVASG